RQDHDRVLAEVELPRLPSTVVHAAEQCLRHGRVDPAALEHTVVAVAGARHVLRPQCAAVADLRCLLPPQAGPDAPLTLPLQRLGLAVEPADHHYVPVETGVLLVGEVDGVLGAVAVLALLDAFPFGGE